MNSFRFIHCSDLHIDSPFKGLSSIEPKLAEILRKSTYQAFQNIVDLAIEEEVEAVLIAGDIYDGSDKSLEAQLKFRSGLQKLSDSGIETFIVNGNHDPLDGWSASLSWPERVHIYSGNHAECFPLIKNGELKAHVYGISYSTRDMRENLALKFIRSTQGFAIGLLHCNVGHQSGHGNYAPCSIEDLIASKMDYWALGHIHRFQVLRESDPAIVYSGNSQARHMRETGEKGCCLVTLNQSAPPVIKFIATDVVRFVQDEVDLSGTISLEGVIHAARAKCEDFADQVKEREIYFNLLLTGRTQIHAELKRKAVLEDLQEEIGAYFKGRIPSIWVSLKLDTLGVYDIESLRQGKDFVADLINLFEIEGKADSFPELEELIKPMFENWQGQKYLKSLTNQEMKDVLLQAKSLCLDKLLRQF